MQRSCLTKVYAFRVRSISVAVGHSDVVPFHARSRGLENAPGWCFQQPRRYFSNDDSLPGASPAVVEQADELEEETKRIIDVLGTKSHECAMIEQKTIDSLMQQWTERATLPQWGNKATAIATELLEALERNAENDATSSISPDTAVYNYVLQAHASCHRSNYDKKPDTAKSASRLLDRMIAKCRETATQAVKSPAPTTRTFNIVLNTWAKSSSADAGERAEEVFRQMENWLLECRQLSLPEAPPDGRSLCAVMDAWVKSGAASSADRVSAMLHVAIDRQKRAKDEGGTASESVVVKPDVVMFNTAIYAVGVTLSKQTDRRQWFGKPQHFAKKAEQLLQLMISLNENGDVCDRNENNENDAGLAPTTRSYNLVLQAWAECCRVDKSGHSAEHAEQLLNSMIKQDQGTGGCVRPECRSFTMCIQAWARSTGFPDCASRAQNIYNQMANLYRVSQDENLKPDVMAGNALVLAWARSNVDDSTERAAKVVEDMEEFSQPDVYTNNILIDAYIRKRDVWKAYDILTKLENSTSVKPDTVSYNSILQALSKDPFRADEAQKLLDRMVTDKIVAPNSISYTCVINAWGNSKVTRENCAQRAAILFERMLEAYRLGDERLKPDVIAFTAAIAASANASRNANEKRTALNFANTIFDLMKQDSKFDHPNPVTYNAIMRTCSTLALNGEERTRLLEARFQQCIDDKMLSRAALDIFRSGVTLKVQQAYSLYSYDAAVPSDWCSKVRISDRPKVS